MIKTILSILSMSLIMACSTSKENINQINESKLLAMSSQEDVVVLDVRTPGEVAKGYVKGTTKFIDYKNSDFDAQISALDKEKTYVVYCRSGNRSTKAINAMSKKGFKNLFELKGGISAVSQENIR